MPSVTTKHFRLNDVMHNDIMHNDVMLNVVAPMKSCNAIMPSCIPSPFFNLGQIHPDLMAPLDYHLICPYLSTKRLPNSAPIRLPQLNSRWLPLHNLQGSFN